MDKAFLTPRIAKLQKELRGAPGLELATVFFHGPACDADGTRRDALELSMIVPKLDGSSREALQRLNGGFWGWSRRGMNLRFLFTPEYIKNALDTFPLEFLDLGIRHVPVQGDAGLARLKYDGKAIRLQCERELRGLILHARSSLCRVPAHGNRARLLFEQLRWAFVPIGRGLLTLKKRGATGSRDEILAAVADQYLPTKQKPASIQSADDLLKLMEIALPAVDRA